MKVHCVLPLVSVVLTGLLLQAEARYAVSRQRSMHDDHHYQHLEQQQQQQQQQHHQESYYIDLTERQDDAVSDNEISDEPAATNQGDANADGEENSSSPPRIHNPFNDFFPYVGKHVYDKTVNTYIVQWLIDRTVAEVMPPAVADFYTKIKEDKTTLYKVISPFRDAVSEYSSSKLRSGVDWTFVGGYKIARYGLAQLSQTVPSFP